MSKVAIVIGAGPALGAAVARRFAREGFSVGVVARQAQTVESLAQEIHGRAYAADTADAAQVDALFARIRTELGAPDVLVYNPGSFKMGGIRELTPEVFDQCWKFGCLCALQFTRDVLPSMLDR